MKYYIVICYWCGNEFNQRQDTVNRQLANYGHSCCKRCFGKEPSFRAAQNARTDSKSHPHTEETKKFLSELKIGATPWNKGLSKESDLRVLAYGEATRRTKLMQNLKGENNNNWKGGVSVIKLPFPNSDRFKEWMKFRYAQLMECNFRCYKCSGAFCGNELEIHHLLSQTRHPGMIFDPRNCFVFCKECHKKFHHEFGKKSFTPMDAVKFINRDRSPENKFKTC